MIEENQMSLYEAMGMMITLASRSKLHRKWYLQDSDYFFVPPIKLNQFRIYFGTNKEQETIPIAFITWAYMSDQQFGHWSRKGVDPNPQEWKTGNHLCFIDFVSPYGYVWQVVKDLRTHIFPKDTTITIFLDNLD